jgi:hypothetical protein
MSRGFKNMSRGFKPASRVFKNMSRVFKPASGVFKNMSRGFKPANGNHGGVVGGETQFGQIDVPVSGSPSVRSKFASLVLSVFVFEICEIFPIFATIFPAKSEE